MQPIRIPENTRNVILVMNLITCVGNLDDLYIRCSYFFRLPFTIFGLVWRSTRPSIISDFIISFSQITSPTKTAFNRFAIKPHILHAIWICFNNNKLHLALQYRSFKNLFTWPVLLLLHLILTNSWERISVRKPWTDIQNKFLSIFQRNYVRKPWTDIQNKLSSIFQRTYVRKPWTDIQNKLSSIFQRICVRKPWTDIQDKLLSIFQLLCRVRFKLRRSCIYDYCHKFKGQKHL